MKSINIRAFKAFKYKAHGIDSVFYTLKWKGNRVGLKLFQSPSECNKIRRFQVKGFRGGVAPAVLGATFKVIATNGSAFGYGYLTEIADVDSRRIYKKEVYEPLCELFNKVFGFYHTDFHEGNVGYVEVGNQKRLVYVDFGF